MSVLVSMCPTSDPFVTAEDPQPVSRVLPAKQGSKRSGAARDLDLGPHLARVLDHIGVDLALLNGDLGIVLCGDVKGSIVGLYPEVILPPRGSDDLELIGPRRRPGNVKLFCYRASLAGFVIP